MSGNCCKNIGPTYDSSSSLLLNIVASETKPRGGWRTNSSCCKKNERRNNGCACSGNANPLNLTNIQRNAQILQVIKNCGC